MTSTTPAPDSAADALADWLSGRRDTELAALLRARPDLVVPPPATMSVLANRARQRASVFRAADELTTADFGVIDALSRLGAVDTAATRRAVLDSLSGRITAKATDRILDRLRALLLVWGPPDALRLVKAAVETVPWRVGRAVDPDTPTREELEEMLTDVNPTAAGAALELLRHCEDLITALGTAPAPALKAGGLGVRELRRLARTADLDERETALLVEVLSAAGLIARGIPDPTPPGDIDDYWAPTTSADGWLTAPTGHRWAVLAGAWLDTPRRPWLVGRRDPNDKPIAALSDEVDYPAAARDRRLILELLAEVPGSAPSPSDMRAALAWRRPRWSGRFDHDTVTETVREATTLAVLAHGSLGSPGKALLHGGDAESEMAAVIPDPVDYILVQADLTAVAPGPLVPELAERIALVADIESAGAATVYRIGEKSVRRALDAGVGADDLHALFAKHSRTPVPQSLSYLIDDVARRHGRLRAGVAASFVRADDPALLVEVLSAPVAATLALRAIAPTVAVSQAPLAELLAELRAAGFAPAGEDSSGAVLDLRPRGARLVVPRSRARYAGPIPPTDEQLATLVRTLRAGDRAASASASTSVRGDGSRTGGAATMSLLQLAVHAKRSVTLGYVDAQGVATRRIVDPVAVGGGQLEAFDPASGTVRSFVLHRVTSVALVD
ncbi:helicase-associated domain-containing protein [Rhodococcus chondri]|uniref:Helicase-associated domain-containing protein n=1 Tax=Rhodococcus chondri TaxID=3065941 RepID=A0ABU7JSL9_9NOCA|nr:helicase-associated domain-containing protein [Rhodococcus sp. CC-R104]MEE2032830.1 helicase-associated domain-containing protein [Rhodococcus sp. CC-R104]